MSKYTSFMRGMLDTAMQSDTYWKLQFEQSNIIKNFDEQAERKKFICDKLSILNCEIKLFKNTIEQFVEYDNVN